MKRKLFIVVFFIFAPVLFYKLLMQYPYYVSEHDTVSLWNPRWTCGVWCPDMMVFKAENVKNNQYVGTDVFWTVKGRLRNEKYYSDERYYDQEYKLVCTGQFKKNIKMKMFEGNEGSLNILDTVLYSNLENVFDAQGVFFDADNCTFVKTTEQDSARISAILKKLYY